MSYAKNYSIMHEFTELIDDCVDFSKILEESLNDYSEEKVLFGMPAKKMKTSHSEISESLDSLVGEENSVTSLEWDLIANNLLYMAKSTKQQVKIVIRSFVHSQIKDIARFHEQREKGEFDRSVKKLILFLKIITQREILDITQVTQMVYLSEYVEELPLLAVYRLALMDVVSFENFLNRIKKTPRVEHLLQEVSALALNPCKYEHSEEIVKMILSSLTAICYEFPDEDFSRLKGIAQDMLKKVFHTIFEKVLDNHISLTLNSSVEAKESSPILENNVLNVYKLALSDTSLSDKSVEKFLSEYLAQLLSFNPEISLIAVIQKQDQWRFIKSNKVLLSFLETIISHLGVDSTLKLLNEVVTQSEVNWGCVLTLLATLLTSIPSAPGQVRDLINGYLRNGCENFEMEYLILGFLFARHASQEGRHIFPPYSQWFAAVFCSESSSPANNKQSFVFLMKFLTQIVPHENPRFLRAHLNQSIFVPRDCSDIYRDYKLLARVRLNELEDTIPHLEFRTKQEMDLKVAEVDGLVEEFSRTAKIPSSVMEASIFQRSYFCNTFLPILLHPRILPSPPDAKMKFVEQLLKAHKISQNKYAAYIKECRLLDDSPDSDVMIIEDDALSVLRQSLHKLLAKAPSSDLEEDPNTHALRILSEVSSSLEDILRDVNSTGSTSSIIIEDQFSHSSAEYLVQKEILDAIILLWERHDCKTRRDSYRGEICQRNPDMELISKLILLLGSSVPLQKCFWSSLFQCLRNNPLSSADKEIFVYGLVLSEMPDSSEAFLPVGREGSASLPPKEFLIRNLPFDSADSLYTSCSLLKSWLEMSMAHASCPPGIKELYCFLAQRVSSMKWPPEALDGKSSLPLSAGWKPNLPRLTSLVPVCCRLFWEVHFEIAAFDVKNWIAFELRAPWGTNTPLDTRINHLCDWLNYHMAEHFEDSSANQKEAFNSLFWSCLEGFSVNNCAEMVILLQRLSGSLSKDFSLLVEWQKYAANGEKVHHLLPQFITLCGCLPPSLFFGDKMTFHQVAPFKECVTGILKLDSALYLSVEVTRYLFEAVLHAGVSQSSPNSIHILHCLESIKDSVILHWKFLKFFQTRYEIAFTKHKCLGHLKSAVESFSLIGSPFPHSPSTLSVLLLASILEGGSTDPLAKQLQNVLAHCRDSTAFLVTFQYFCRHLGSLLMTGSFPLLPDDEEANFWDDLCRNPAIPHNTDKRHYFLFFCVKILTKLEAIVPLEKLLSDNEWLDHFYPSSWKLFLLGGLRIALSLLDSRRLTPSEPKDFSYYAYSAFYWLDCLCKLFNRNVKLDVHSQGDSDSDLDFLTEVHRKVVSYFQAFKGQIGSIPDFILSACDREAISFLCIGST